MTRIFIALCIVLLGSNGLSCHGQISGLFDKVFLARDSLPMSLDGVPGLRAATDETRALLEGIWWKPEAFEITCERPLEWRYDCLVKFPSAWKTGDRVNDSVVAEWHMARNEAGEIITAPALIVVHESGRSMAVGRTFAMLFSRAGLHTFMVQMPGYGVRSNPEEPGDGANFVQRARQAVSDVRRARDAAAVLPFVDSTHIGLQGTSLGGFISATAAGIDGKFDSVFIMLAGGDIYKVIAHGQKDAAKIRKRLAGAGLEGTELEQQLARIEPNLVANRLNPQKTWLFSAKHDTVVPLENALTWARAVGLDSKHHIILQADHYSGITYIPTMVFKVRDLIRAAE